MPVVTMAVMTVHTVTTMTVAMTTAAVTVAVATMATRFSTGSDDRRQAHDGRGDESEECSTFEHLLETFGFGVEPSVPVVGTRGPQVQAIDFQGFFIHLTFIDGAPVWQNAGSRPGVTACTTA
jgi:hypothetical protein